jgi:hypothetical protein
LSSAAATAAAADGVWDASLFAEPLPWGGFVRRLRECSTLAVVPDGDARV